VVYNQDERDSSPSSRVESVHHCYRFSRHSCASGNPLWQPLRTLDQKWTTRLHTTCYLLGGEQRKENP
jgi:hypothetical protein